MKTLSVIIFALATQSSWTQDKVEASTTVSGFVDTYYAFSFSKLPTRDRGFTTQPLRHNEFNLNLAMIDIKHQAETFRGRFAFQTGTYVQSNLVAEPSLLKNVLEASVGTRLGQSIWVDFGVFPSHIGLEGIVSKDNWTYSRSLLADYSPYYEAGISVTAAVSDQVTLRGLLLNGWQNIQETNNDKAIGTQIQYKPSGSILLNWSTFIGNEQPDSVASRLRLFSDLYAVLTLSKKWSVGLVFDAGMQKQVSGGSYDVWHAAAIMVRKASNEQWAVAGRAEYFMDKYGVIIPTGTSGNFQTVSGSVNLDFSPSRNVLWRIEARVFRSKDRIYPSNKGLNTTDGFLTASAAISF